MLPNSTRLVLLGATLLTTVLLCTSISAAVFHLHDGSQIPGSYIGKAKGTVTYLGVDGKTAELSEADIFAVDWNHKLSAKMEKKAARERRRFLEKRRKQAGKVVRRLERTRDEEKQARIYQELATFEEPELIPALGEALDSNAAHARNFAFHKLLRFKSRGAIVPLIRASVSSNQTKVAARGHTTALERDRELAREVYEYLTLTAKLPERLRSMEALTDIGDRKSVPRLVRVMTYVQADIRAQMVRLKRMKEVPVNLGSLQRAATQVTIELPEVELIEVMTSFRVPVESLQRLETAAERALTGITGQNFGKSSTEWQRWWDEQSEATPLPTDED